MSTPARQNIHDLREHLFETMKALRDKEQPMDVDRAMAVAAAGKVLVDSIKVEVDMVRVVGAAKGTGVIPVNEDALPEGRDGRRLSAVGGGR